MSSGLIEQLSSACRISLDCTTVEGAPIVFNQTPCALFVREIQIHYDARLSNFHLEDRGVHMYMEHSSVHRAVEIITIFNANVS